MRATLDQPIEAIGENARAADATTALGANHLGSDLCSFNVWAPGCEKVSVFFPEQEREVTLARTDHGYHCGIIEEAPPGTRYFFRLPDKLRPDPASRFQPETVHAASQVVDPAFKWDDQHWAGLRLHDHVLYELHVGTATQEGTFDALIPMLSRLKDLGITAIEIMPVAQFPGSRNWGYDGVYPFAVQNSYGGPDGLKRLVNACHSHDLAVVLDVVYNHLGPEGNYLRDFGPYFNPAYRTPWGDALNFDGEHSDQVRRFFVENALRWQEEFHFDGLRLDAVHAIKDFSAVSFLQELAQACQARAARVGRLFHLIAESDSNDPRVIRPMNRGGFGLDAQWSDDFHHCLHVLLTGERAGYYFDFGGVKQFAKILTNGYAYTGEYSRFRKRKHGAKPDGATFNQFIVCAQNHDQIGNRRNGERLSALVDLEKLKLAAGALLLSPFLPMLFMGEEYGEPAPFLYAVSHEDPALVQAVRAGRTQEFAAFDWAGDAPDPFAMETFARCRLNPQLLDCQSKHQALYGFYRELLRLRKGTAAIAQAEKPAVAAEPFEDQESVVLKYAHPRSDLCVLFNFSERPQALVLDLPAEVWSKALDSKAGGWGGPGSDLPQRLESTGRVFLNVPPTCVAAYASMPVSEAPASNVEDITGLLPGT